MSTLIDKLKKIQEIAGSITVPGHLFNEEWNSPGDQIEALVLDIVGDCEDAIELAKQNGEEELPKQEKKVFYSDY